MQLRYLIQNPHRNIILILIKRWPEHAVNQLLTLTKQLLEENNMIENDEGTFSEATLESARHVTQVPHPASSGGLSADCLDAPVI